MAGKEVVRYEATTEAVRVPSSGPTFDIFNDVQLRALYGQVMRVFAAKSTFIDFDPDADEYELSRKLRQELVRRRGDGWLTRWHRA